jgi:hypothetical protein
VRLPQVRHGTIHTVLGAAEFNSTLQVATLNRCNGQYRYAIHAKDNGTVYEVARHWDHRQSIAAYQQRARYLASGGTVAAWLGHNQEVTQLEQRFEAQETGDCG